MTEVRPPKVSFGGWEMVLGESVHENGDSVDGHWFWASLSTEMAIRWMGSHECGWRPRKWRFGGWEMSEDENVHQKNSLVDIVSVVCAVILEQLLLADCGYEFLEVEWFEVGYVFEEAGVEGCHGRSEH